MYEVYVEAPDFKVKQVNFCQFSKLTILYIKRIRVNCITVMILKGIVLCSLSDIVFIIEEKKI